MLEEVNLYSLGPTATQLHPSSLALTSDQPHLTDFGARRRQRQAADTFVIVIRNKELLLLLYATEQADASSIKQPTEAIH